METMSKVGLFDGEIELDLFIEARAYLALRGRQLEAGPELSDSWERFYAAYAPLIRRFIRSRGVSNDDEHDCAQDVWRGVIGALADGRLDPDPGRLKSWFFGMVRNKVADICRRRARTPRPGGEAFGTMVDPRAADPAGVLERELAREIVQHAMAELEHRVASRSYKSFVLQWVEGLTPSEIARTMGMTPAQVRARNHRVAKLFRHSLGLRDDGRP